MTGILTCLLVAVPTVVLMQILFHFNRKEFIRMAKLADRRQLVKDAILLYTYSATLWDFDAIQKIKDAGDLNDLALSQTELLITEDILSRN